MNLNEIQEEVEKLEQERLRLDMKEEWTWEDEKRERYLSSQIKHYMNLMNRSL